MSPANSFQSVCVLMEFFVSRLQDASALDDKVEEAKSVYEEYVQEEQRKTREDRGSRLPD